MRGFLLLTISGIAVAACGACGDTPCEETKTCDVGPDPTGSTSSSGVGGAPSTSSSSSSTGVGGGGGEGGAGGSAPGPTVPSLGANANSACFARPGGQLFCWGREFGDFNNFETPLAVSQLDAVRSVAVGASHYCAVKMDGTVWCAGAGTNGQLGNGSDVTSKTPVQVVGITNAVEVAANGNNSCAILANQGLRCWGSNSAGNLGDGTKTRRVSPITVPLQAVTSVGVGSDSTCAVHGGGQVSCWGSGSQGQLGDNGTTESLAPKAVSGIANGAMVSSGFIHHSLLRTNNEVWFWGIRLGSGGSAEGSPTQLSGVTGAKAISAHNDHACALMQDGSVRCWGDGGSGELGNAGTADWATPQTVMGLPSPAIAIAVGDNFSCAATGPSEAYCWGADNRGQLGNGPSGPSTTAVKVQGL